MKKEITVYELLGLIKDDNKPNKIRYDSHFWNLKKEFNDYFDGEKYLIADGFDVFFDNAKEFLNDKVEILEEDKSMIEKIDTTTENTLFTMECYTGIPEQAQDWNFNVLKNKINEIIDYINRKENR
mgnify:CR=1 FL=1